MTRYLGRNEFVNAKDSDFNSAAISLLWHPPAMLCVVQINVAGIRAGQEYFVLKGTHRSGFCKFGSKTYIELFTYLCGQIIELALYTHLNSAKKNILLQKVSFVACPIVLR